MAAISPLQVFALGADTVYLKSRPLPTAPDGQYDSKTSSQSGGPGATQEHSALTNVIHNVQSQITKGAINPDPKVVAGFIDSVVNPTATDDRKGAFAAGLTLLSRLPPDSDVAKDMANSAVGMLYNTIPHPTETFLGPEYTFRQADGGFNNIQQPNLGRAGTPYARSVQSQWCISPQALPDPGLVFDTLLKRRKIMTHPNGNASFTFAFASLVTHSLFRTNMKDWTRNETSSYLDLSPLYGINQETQDQYVADMILKINEHGKWSDPAPDDATARAKQDEEIFQTARLINCGHFMSLIMGDYVAGFLGLSEGNAWNMNAFDPIKDKNGNSVQRGEGNHCSVEFSILYRWHSTTSEWDEKWITNVFQKTFNKSLDTVTIPDFAQAFRKVLTTIEPNPSKREFGGLKRGPDGKFSDDDLARVLQDATENVACSFGAHGTPEALKVVEVMGIMQARQWGVCTMNEFRRWLGLKEFESFEEWNPDPEVASAARRLYKHIDNLELYTGLQCESIMPLSGGLRFACGYTTTRAVLSDAIALVRGDRFCTTSFTPGNLTAWGYQDCLRDSNNGGFGGEMPKLLMRHLPRHYPFNSVYGCFPFFTPGKMKESLTRLGMANQYTFERPKAAVPVKVLHTFTGIKKVFDNPTLFPVVYELKGLGAGYGNMLGFDEATKHDADRSLALHALFPTKDSMDAYRKYYRDGVAKKIEERSFTLSGVSGKFVDIVQDVINMMSVHWAADCLCGIDVKTKDNPRGIYTEQEVWEMLAEMYTLIFLSIGDNENGFSLRKKVMQAGGVLQALVAKSIVECAPKSAGTSSSLLGFISTVHGTIDDALNLTGSDRPYKAFLKKLGETGRPVNELVSIVIGLAVGSSVDYAQAAVQVIDFYLDDARASEKAEIVKLAKAPEGDKKSLELLQGYVREGMRLNPQVPGLYRGALGDASIPQGDGLPNVEIKKGDRIYGSFANAHLNATDFPNPTQVNPTRPASSYCYNGTGFHKCPGTAYSEQTITEIVKVVFGLKGVRRAPGNEGKLQGFTLEKNETPTKVYMTPYGQATPWPGSMVIMYDE